MSSVPVQKPQTWAASTGMATTLEHAAALPTPPKMIVPVKAHCYKNTTRATCKHTSRQTPWMGKANNPTPNRINVTTGVFASLVSTSSGRTSPRPPLQSSVPVVLYVNRYINLQRRICYRGGHTGKGKHKKEAWKPRHQRQATTSRGPCKGMQHKSTSLGKHDCTILYVQEVCQGQPKLAESSFSFRSPWFCLQFKKKKNLITLRVRRVTEYNQPRQVTRHTLCLVLKKPVILSCRQLGF